MFPGFALDLTTADEDGSLLDFDSKVMRDRFMAKVKNGRPQLFIGSPMCTASSTRQQIHNLNRDSVTVAARKRRAVPHLSVPSSTVSKCGMGDMLSMSTQFMQRPGRRK